MRGESERKEWKEKQRERERERGWGEVLVMPSGNKKKTFNMVLINIPLFTRGGYQMSDSATSLPKAGTHR